MNIMVRTIRTLAFTVVMVAITAVAAVGIQVLAQEEAVEATTFDIAESMVNMSFDEAPVHENGMPNGGNAFIIHGYIYPEGTLDGTSGVNPDGSPEFPELVLGEWICRGYFINEGPLTTAGAWAITTQTFNVGDVFGSEMLVTDGYELAEPNVPLSRAITGGTGSFTGAEGTVTQTMIGMNATGAPNLRITLNIAE